VLASKPPPRGRSLVGALDTFPLVIRRDVRTVPIRSASAALSGLPRLPNWREMRASKPSSFAGIHAGDMRFSFVVGTGAKENGLQTEAALRESR
jgi:hypothetical protein